MSIQEAWEAVETLCKREFVFTGAGYQTPEQVEFSRKEAEQTSPKGWVVRQSAINDAARNLALVSHVDACPWHMDNEGDESNMYGRECGDGWYCEKAQEIERLGGSDEPE